MTTSALVSHFDSRMPTAATTPSTAAISTAPTLTGADSPNSPVGSPSASCRYADQPRETTAAPRANSRIRSQAMIQAKISPIVV